MRYSFSTLHSKLLAAARTPRFVAAPISVETRALTPCKITDDTNGLTSSGGFSLFPFLHHTERFCAAAIANNSPSEFVQPRALASTDRPTHKPHVATLRGWERNDGRRPCDGHAALPIAERCLKLFHPCSTAQNVYNIRLLRHYRSSRAHVAVTDMKGNKHWGP